MTASLRAPALAAGALAVALGAASSTAWAQGTSKTGLQSGNLTFAVTARVFYKDGTSAPAPAQTIDAKVWLSGRKARLDTTLSGRPMRLLFSPPFAYRLLPNAKIGQKYRASSLPSLAAIVPGSDGFSPNPAAIRAALIRGGARKTGTSSIGGVPVDVYSSNRFRGRADTVKAFLRRSDALPTRVEVSSKNFSAIASWSNYQKPRALSPALFAVPAGFKIREGTASRGF